MSTQITRLRQVHRFLARQSFYPLLLSSALAVVLFAGQVYRSHSPASVFLVWNLILAWFPYLSSLWADRYHRRFPGQWWYLVAPGLLWLAFFPNAPYLVTDLWHLRERPPVPLWYDLGMLAIFALTGLFLAVFSLRIMQQVVRRHVGPFFSWVFVFVVVGLGGLGVYLGRFLRWNSWDLPSPRSVLGDIAIRLARPWEHPQTLGFTLLCAAILLVCYRAMTSREPV